MDAGLAALPMYDWAECRGETDAHWQALRRHLRDAGIEAPEHLARRNRDLPALPGGLKDAEGQVIAPDPASLPADDLDVEVLWRHPGLLLAQTCWGPLSRGLARHVRALAQPRYDRFEGGQGIFYSSVIVMHRRSGADAVSAPADGAARIPWSLLENRVFVFNASDSMSGTIALCADCHAAGKAVPDLDAGIRTGGHRESIRALARGEGDFAAIDCRSWQLALEHEPAARELLTVGWTRRRRGLPIITSLQRGEDEVRRLKRALTVAGYEPV